MVIRISVLMCLVLFYFPAPAQNKFGFYTGPQATTAHYKVGDNKQPAQLKYGAQAGFVFKTPFENKLYFAPALYYSLKGYKVTLKNPAFPPDVDAKNNDTRIHTIDIAPLLQYDFTSGAAHFFFRAGPSLEFAIAGTEKYNEISGRRINQKMKFSFGDYGYATASAIGHVGYEMSNRFFIFGHYAYGLGNANNADEGPVIRHRVAGISVGKYF